MSNQESEKTFLRKAERLIPEISGYRELGARRDTDGKIREYLAVCLEGLRARFGEIRSVADEEGDLDMVEDLDRLAERIGRTSEGLRSADYGGCGFFHQSEVPEDQFDRIYAYDTAMLEDLELLSNDVEALKYESIGSLTLREVEGTLASIELRLVNRKDLFEAASA